MYKKIALLMTMLSAACSMHAGRGGEAFGGAMVGSMTGSLIAGAASRPSGGGGSSYVLKRLDRLESAFEARVQRLEEAIDEIRGRLRALTKDSSGQISDADVKSDADDKGTVAGEREEQPAQSQKINRPLRPRRELRSRQ